MASQYGTPQSVDLQIIKYSNQRGEQMKRVIYSIEGNIGSGKSTLLRMLTKQLENLVPLSEPVHQWQNVGEYNLLDVYYKNPERWAYTFQTNAILSRMGQLRRSIQKMDHHKAYICERSIMSDKYIFARLLRNLGKMSEMEHCLYEKMFAELNDLFETPKTHKYIYLKTSPSKSFERIQKRAREQEAKLSFDYINRIHNLHQEWLLKEEKPENVLTLDGQQEFETDNRSFHLHNERISDFMGSSHPKMKRAFI